MMIALTDVHDNNTGWNYPSRGRMPTGSGTTCYQNNILFIVMSQGASATTLSSSDLSIIQPARECTASGLQVWTQQFG